MTPPALPLSVSPKILLLRRMAIFVPSALIAAFGCYLGWQLAGGLEGVLDSPLDLVAFTVFTLLFTMLSFTSWAVLTGLVLWFVGRGQVPLEREAMTIPMAELVPSTATRTAILVPAYHEDPHEVFARVHTMRQSLAALQPKGMKSDIDIFILSDSQNSDSIETEAKTYEAFVAALDGHGPAVFYRRRPNNTGYKVGNIKEFCTRWGGAYDHMLVLDADSLMSGQTIRRMITLMERHPRVGLLQTCFIPIGRDTLFCRIMQFSTRLYLMPAALGLEFWQGANGNYWGHNAIMRTKAFTETCGLPELPGKAPLGGRILSHDIVEAALISRGGWEAWLLPNIPGTYEELPTNLIDFMQRDRRWCAGNLQHQHIIRADKVPFGNRMHMILGIMAYASGPLWLTFISLGLLGSFVDSSSMGVQLATAGLFTPTDEGTTLFALTMTLLFGPKLLTLLQAFLRPTVRKSFGGGLRLLQSAVLEQLFIVLQQPTVMLFYTTFVITPLFGQVVKWEAQPRSERGITWKEAFARHKYHVALALMFAAVLVASHKTATVVGLTPVIVGLLLSPAFTVFTSRASLGRKARSLGMFLTPDELMPEPEVKALQLRLEQPLKAPKGKVVLPELPNEAPATMPTQLLRYPKVQALPQSGMALEEASGN